MAAAVMAAMSMPGPGHAQQAADGILDIKEIKSPSGITAWLVEDHSLPVIALSFAFHGAGAALDPVEKQGLSILASNTMDEGAGEYDSQTFQKMLSDHSISLSFSSGRDDFGGSVKTLTRHSEMAFNLLKLALMQPRFDADAVERMRAANISRVRNSVSDPDWIAARIMNDAAFAGHPYALNSGGTLTTLASLTPDDLKNFVKTRLAREHLYITVTGDITPAALRKMLDDVFGGLPPQLPLPAVADMTVQNGGQHAHYDMDIPQTIIQAMQPGISRDDPDYYAAAIMDFILGGSGFGSRLTEEVREKRGLTYGIHTGFYQMDHLKAYTVGTSTRNESAAEVIELIRAEWTKMRDTPVSDTELKDAKSYLIGSLPLALSSTDSIAGLLLGLRLENLPIDYLDARAAKIDAVTAEDIQRVAKRLLVPDQLTLVTVGRPEKVTLTKVVES
ncbi:MAG: insulinase family protein, partial [Alphaproteobacteria bacterium]|nr:insulinase family protein [Alphaproteobacteria bacterium]